MRLAIMTDIHGNLEAFEACLADARDYGVTRYVILGDFVGYGADPEAVVQRAREVLGGDGIAVKGNHDAAASGDGMSLVKMNPEAAKAIHWTRRKISAETRNFLAGLPLTRRAEGALFVHAEPQQPGAWGHVRGPMDALRSLKAAPDRLVFCGHMHSTMLYQMQDGRLPVPHVTAPNQPVQMRSARDCSWLAVIGAVGQPRDGDARAAYGIFEMGTLAIRRVPYDIDAAAAKIRKARLPASLAKRLQNGL
jgi:diadenosine tetraphosphatase ApaH/serine/threonine PP2A family protein phosphatase